MVPKKHTASKAKDRGPLRKFKTGITIVNPTATPASLHTNIVNHSEPSDIPYVAAPLLICSGAAAPSTPILLHDNSFAALMVHESFEDIMQSSPSRNVSPSQHAVNPNPLLLGHGSQEGESTPGSSMSSPPIFECGSNFNLESTMPSDEEKEFMYAMGVDMPSPSDSGKRRRIENADDSASSFLYKP